MLSVLSITLPIFALVGLGYILTYRRVFAPRDMAVLGNFVMSVALPALLFQTTATRPFGELVDPVFFGLLALAGLSTQALIWLVLKLGRIGPARRAIGVLGAATPNSAFLAFPMMIILFPDYAPQILAMCLLVENFVLSPVGLMLVGAATPQRSQSAWARLGTLVLSVLRRPFVIGLILGAVVSISGLHLPIAMERTLTLLSQAASPLALFFIGGSLVGLPLRGNLPLAGTITAFKLLVHPLMAFLWIGVIGLVGLGLPNVDWEHALILSAAMPIFGVFPLLAKDTGHAGAASLAVMVSTIAAFVTLTVLVAVML